jgi:hypothetical protein
MKEIKFNGVEVRDIMQGRIAGGEEVKIKKLNSQGMLLETTAKLSFNRRYKFQLVCNDQKTTLNARVTDVLLKKNVEKNKKTVHLSHVAVEFVDIREDDVIFLNTVIEKSLEQKVPELQNLKTELLGSKFQAKK